MAKVAANVTSADNCLLTGLPPIDVTHGEGQSFLYCKYDDDNWKKRCCTKTHDEWLKFAVRGYWPELCAKKTYPGFDKFMCFMCHPQQPKYT